jgi:hypothetical protein
VTVPVGAAPIDPLDMLAHKELLEAAKTQVSTVRARAEKWIGGISALTGLLAIVFVLEGPDSVSGLELWWKVGIAVAFGLALIVMAVATYMAYSAAFGAAVSEPESVIPYPADGLNDRLLDARRRAESAARSSLKAAVILTFVGILFAAGGITASWFAEEESGGDKFSCLVNADNVELARFPGKSLEVTSTGEGVRVASCS